MNDKARMGVFLTIFLSVYVLIHAYTIGRLWTWAGLAFGTNLVWLITGLAVSYPLATLLESKYLNWATRIYYTLATVWMGTLTILLLTVLAGEIVVLLVGPTNTLLAILITTIAGAVFALFSARRFVVREHTITGRVKKPLTIAVATDVHAGAVHGKRYIGFIVDAINKHGADIALFPGDLVDGPGKLPDDLLEPLDRLAIPAIHSFGNHEFYVGEQEVKRVLKGRKIVSLQNTFKDVAGVRVIGINDAEDRKQVATHLRGLTKKEGYNILLYHRPDGLEDAAKEGVDLMLSGHTHNGQIFPFTLLVRLRFPRKKGWYTYKHTKLFVSTGAGTWGPPMRLGSRSEVVFITVQPEKK